MPSPHHQSPITLRDIARTIGISHVTVSLALRNNPKIPEARRQQIQAAARELGYQPNPIAAALAHHKYNTANPPVKAALAWLNQWPQPGQLRSFSEYDCYWKGAFQAAEKFGYRLEEFVCGKSLSLPRVEKILLTRNIHGILLPPHQPGARWDALNWRHFCAARFGRSIPSPRLHIVTSDQVANTILAFKEIRQRGYERVGFVTEHASDRGALFNAGFLMAQSQLGKTLQLPICVLDETERGKNHGRLGQWLRQTKPDAILTDVAATRERLHKLGCKVPDDVGLAALSVLDGNADAGINQHPEEIGRVATLLVISLVNDNARGLPPIFRQILVEGSWVDGSTLPTRQRTDAGLSAAA